MPNQFQLQKLFPIQLLGYGKTRLEKKQVRKRMPKWFAFFNKEEASS